MELASDGRVGVTLEFDLGLATYDSPEFLMPDERTTADELIAELVESAIEFTPVDAATFETEVRDELATFRELREEGFREGPAEPRSEGEYYRGPRTVVPGRYRDRAEVFIVFETFVRFFVDPVLVAAAIPGLLERVSGDRAVARIAFARFGEESNAQSVRQLVGIAEDAQTMRALAAELGRTLFGQSFRESEFWQERE